MNQKPFKIKVKRDFALCLKKTIGEILLAETFEEVDKMHLCLLAEIREKLYQRLGKDQYEFQIQFSPAQAIALRILYTDYIKDGTTYEGNKLLQISNEVHKHYF